MSRHSGHIEFRIQIYKKKEDDAFWVELGDGRPTPLGHSHRNGIAPEFKVEDLRRLNNLVKRKLDEVAIELSDAVSPNESDSERSMRILADLGYEILTSVFSERIITRLDAAFRTYERVALDIVSDDFVIPWEILHSGAQEDPLDYKKFWGYKYVITRMLRYSDDQSLLHPDIYVLPLPKIGLLAKEELTHVVEKEIPFFEALNDHGRAILFRFDASRGESTDSLRTTLWRFLGQPYNVTHFACHTRPNREDEPEDRSCLELTDGLDLCFSDLRKYGVELKENPLIFLNSCDTAVRDPRQTFTIIRSLLQRGARGVIATECKMPDVFAAAFIEEFYERFLAGEQLGDAMLAARRLFLENFGNPLGLFYVTYNANANTRLIEMR